MKALREILSLLGLLPSNVSGNIDLDTSVPDQYPNGEGLAHLIAWNDEGDSVGIYAESAKIHSVVRFSTGGSLTAYAGDKGLDDDVRHSVLEGQKLAIQLLVKGRFSD